MIDHFPTGLRVEPEGYSGRWAVVEIDNGETILTRVRKRDAVVEARKLLQARGGGDLDVCRLTGDIQSVTRVRGRSRG